MSMRLLNHRRRADAGFTLVELMIVVVIIGILAAIAIPNFIKFQLRSKAGEVGQIMGGIHAAESGFAAKWGAYVLATQQPTVTPSNGQKGPWTPAAADQGYSLVGYSPQGRTYHAYVVSDDTAYAVTSTNTLPAVAGDGTFGIDNGGFPCAVPGGATACTASNNVQASNGTVDIVIAAIGDLDSDGNDCTYAITDENKDVLPNRTNGVCAENAF